MAAYAFNALEIFRSRFAGVKAFFPRASSAERRSANCPSLSLTLIVRFGISISIISQSLTSPIFPPAAASGEMCPIDNPDVPPEKRPSVIRAHSFPKCLDFM